MQEMVYPKLESELYLPKQSSFPKIDASGKIGNKGLHREEKNISSKKKLPAVGIESGTLGLLL